MSALRLARTQMESVRESPIVAGNLLIGLTLDQAKIRYPGIRITPSKIDGQSQEIAFIYDIRRHLVHVENGVISLFVGNT